MPVLAPIRGLRSFCVAAQCLSFKNAAAQLFLTPSAISHQVKQLEQLLGIVLFERQTRSIELTREGSRFYASIRPIMSELESTISEFTQLKEKTVISVSMPEFFASELFIPRLREWTELNSDIDLQLETVKTDQSPTKPTDLSIVLANGTPNAQQVHELFPLRYVPACNQSIYQKWFEKGYEAINSVPLILHQSRPWAWHQWADRALVDDFEPIQVIQLDSMFSVARAAQQGMGIALVPMPISQTWFSNQLLFKLYKDELITNDRYFLVQQIETKVQSAVGTFSDWVKKTYRDCK